MASGARLRSSNTVFGRSRTGAFLINLPPPITPYTCNYIGQASVTSQGDNYGAQVPETDENCNCSTFAVAFADRGMETRLSMSQQRGMGWEDPPHPPVRFTGQTSGHVVTIPTHCCTQVCPRDANTPNWEGYAANAGIVGADFLCVKNGLFNREGELPVTNQVAYACYAISGPGSPWTDGEQILMEIDYTADTLPDPGPYNIQSVVPDPNATTNFMRFNLDRLPRYTTQSAVQIADTDSAYDGIWEANLVTNELGSYLDVLVPNYGPLGIIGTLTRVYEPTWDCWNNTTSPTTPKPPVPGGSTPQALTIGESSVFDPTKGFLAGSYGALAPSAWEGIEIAELTGNYSSDIVKVATVGNVPLYGNNGIYLWIEGFYGPGDGRWSLPPVVVGQGTYQITNASLAEYFRDNVGNTLIVGISENV